MAHFDFEASLNISEPVVKLQLQDYLERLTDIELKEQSLSLFIPYREVISNINSMYGVVPPDSFPEVFIHVNSELDPRTVFGGIIEMGDGYLTQCINVKMVDFKEVDEEYTDDLNVEQLAPMVSMMWIYSHEYFHFVRRHEDVIARLKEIEGSNFDQQLTDYAVESDADLCGIAVVYRYLQHIHQKLVDDSMLRRLALYLIFWWIRPQLTLIHGRQHLSMATRLFKMIAKLSILTKENGVGIVDVDFKEERSKTNLAMLLKLVVNCENIYRQRFDDSDGTHSLKQFIQNLDKNEAFYQTSRRWNEIRSIVRDVSGTMA